LQKFTDAVQRVGDVVRNLWARRKIQSVLSGVDRWDLRIWGEAVEGFPQAAESNEHWGALLGGEPVRDAFWALLRDNPALADPVPAGLGVLADLFQRAMETPDWKQLHEICRGDELTSIVGAWHFVNEFLAHLPEEVRQEAAAAREKAERALTVREAVENHQALVEMLTEAGRLQESQEAEKATAGLAQAARQAEIEAQSAAAAYQQSVRREQARVAYEADQGALTARSRGRETVEWISGFSLAAGGDSKNISPETIQAAMETLRRNPNLKKLSEFLGWAKRAARAAWRKSPHGKIELTGYRIQEFMPETMAPWEMLAAVAGTPATRLDWQRRVIDGGVVHRQFSGKERLGRGPLIVIRDESDSMRGLLHSLTVAVEWSLLEIARRDRRDFYCIPFSGPGEYSIWRAAAAGSPDPEGLLRHLGHFYGHGTEPYGPLAEALDLIEKKALRADLLLLTDAAFKPAAPEFLSRLRSLKERLPLHIVTLVIGPEGEGSAGNFSDTVLPVADLIQEKEILGKAFEKMV